MKCSLLLLVLCHIWAVCIDQSCEGKGTLYVKPTEDTQCPGLPCHVFLFYIDHPASYFTSNTTIQFLPGEHTVATPGWITFDDAFNLSLVGVSGQSKISNTSSAEITCLNLTAFVFRNVSGLVIKHLTFSSCGGKLGGNRSKATLLFMDVFHLTLCDVTVQNSSGFGIMGFQILGNSIITDSVFTRNVGSSEYAGGNAFLQYWDKHCHNITNAFMLNITISKVLFGQMSGGLTIKFTQSCYSMTVNINGVIFKGNTAGVHEVAGGNVLLVFSGSAQNTVLIGNSSVSDGYADLGGGVAIAVGTYQPCRFPILQQNVVQISDTAFTRNTAYYRGGAVVISVREACIEPIVLIHNVSFSENKAMNNRRGVGGHIALDYDGHYSNVTITNSHFTNGSAAATGGAIRLTVLPDVFCHPTTIPRRHLVHIVDSQLITNFATQGGGGLGVGFAFCTTVNLHLTRVAFFKNCVHKDFSGGNILVTDLNSKGGENIVTLENSTVCFAEMGGGMAIAAQSSPCTNDTACVRDKIYIRHTLFQDNLSYNSGGGLALSFEQLCCSIAIHIMNSKFLNNKIILSRNASDEYRKGGGNIHLYINGNLPPNNYIKMENTRIEGGIADFGGGIGMGHDIVIENAIQLSKCSSGDVIILLEIVHCIFVNNDAWNGAALSIVPTNAYYSNRFQYDDSSSTRSHHIRIINSSFDSRFAQQSNVKIESGSDFSQFSLRFEVVFVNTTFFNRNPEPTYLQIALVLNRIMNATFVNCKFSNSSTSTALLAIATNLIFQGDNYFEDNHGVDGGALALCSNSIMILTRDSHIEFNRNHANHTGGAIYIEEQCSIVDPTCFFQAPTELIPDGEFINPSVVFENNTANFAGSAVYGGYVDFCHPLYSTSWAGSPTFDSIFKVQGAEDSSAITSNPRGVCFCINNVPQCNNEFPLGVRVFPYAGAMFNVSAVLVGQKFGTVPGTVHAVMKKSEDSDAQLDDLQDSQVVGKTCTILSYTVFSNNTNETVVLLPEQQLVPRIHRYQKDLPYPEILVYLQPCPWGFTLATPPMVRCVCVDQLRQYQGITCDIDTEMILRPSQLWIGYFHSDSNSTGVVVHDHCPFDYCRYEEVYLRLNETDKQCAFNHSGILCGGCQSGLSLALGSSQCMKCSNAYTTLIFPFIAAGFALVFLLTAWDLTVAEGTINGLIFYANTIHINQAIFFPHAKSNPLAVFIAWLNLDLGIETCFSENMDAYRKIWLQFMFPVYIWVIVGIMIVSSHYYITAAKLFRRNAVKVLATLFLLSFAKLLRTIIAAFSFTYIFYPDGTRKALWLYDGNVEYLIGEHVILFVAALVFLLFLVTPYTLILLFVQWLHPRSNYRLLSWVTKCKPFLDAYTGPYKDSYFFWTGFLLVIRIIFFLIFAFNVLGNPAVRLLVITITSCLMSFAPNVYRKFSLNLLERSFFTNLGIVSATTLFTPYINGNQDAVISVSAGIAFATFCGIFTFHSYHCVTTSRTWERFLANLPKRQAPVQGIEIIDMGVQGVSDSGDEHHHDIADIRAAIKPLELKFDEYREPLLAYETDGDAN